MTWEEFYMHIWGWEKEYAIEQTRKLTGFGDPAEIATVVYMLFEDNKKMADEFVLKALKSNVYFNPDNIISLDGLCSDDVIRRLVLVCSKHFSNKDLNELRYVVPNWLLKMVAKIRKLKFSPDAMEEFEAEDEFSEDVPDGIITWKEFYDKYFEWSESVAIKKLDFVEKLGSTDEIIDVLISLFTTDEAGADKLIKRALDEKVQFSLENISDIAAMCSNDVIKKLISINAGNLTDNDMASLYGFVDDEVLIEISHQFNLRDIVAEEEKKRMHDLMVAANAQQMLNAIELANAAIQELVQAQEYLIVAGNVSAVDLYTKGHYSSVMKHALLVDAENCICNAQGYLSSYNNEIQNLSKRSAHVKFSAMDVVVDTFRDSSFMDCFIHLQIGKSHKQVGRAIRQIERSRNKLINVYNQLIS